ncbi:hypothetical protein ACKWTF_005751 [Chironomus riparius]
MKSLVILFALFCSAFGFVEFDHPCRDTVPAKENFSPAFFTGIWFEVLHSLNGEDADMVQCIDHHYTRRGLQQVFDVERTGIFRGTRMAENSIVRVAFPDESPMRALLNGTVERVTGGSIEYFYRIHASDYTNYAIIWSCTELPNSRSREEISVLGRSISLSESVYIKVGALLEDIGLQDHLFRYILHSPEA